jgi:hypothetical protein
MGSGVIGRRRRLAGAYLAILFATSGVQSFSSVSFDRRSATTPITALSASTASSKVMLGDDSGMQNGKGPNKNKKKRISKPFVNQATIRFNNQLNGMARNFDKHTADKVEELLRKTLRDVSMGLELEIMPNVVTFTAAINAWARSRRPDAAERAEQILQWMLELSPVTTAAGSDSAASTNPDEVDLADVLFVKPNCIAFNAAITAWVRSSAKDSHNHAERLMDQMWDLYMASDQDPELKPSARTFNLVINAIARSREPRCGDRAAALLRKMEDLYTAGDAEMEPDSQTFGAIINAYANDSQNDPQSTDKAAQILQQMNSMYQLGYEGVKPTTFVYNACLNAFAKSEGNAGQASQLLEMMELQYSKGDLSLKPDVISYSTCINAHANSKTLESGPMAEAVLKRMTQRYLMDGDKGAKPNAFTYTATIKAWVASAAAAAAATTTGQQENDSLSSLSTSAVTPQAAERAHDILTNMCLQYLAGDGDQKPTKVTFDLVHHALVNAGDKESAALIVALKKRILDHKLPRRESV